VIAQERLLSPRRERAGAAQANLSRTEPIVPFSHAATSMGGRLVIHLDADSERRREGGRATAEAVARIESWAARLTRHSSTSDLSILNADPADEVSVRPTLAAALRAGRIATESSEGLTDITLLDARLAAEGANGGQPGAVPEAGASRAFDWSIAPGRHGSGIVRRPPGLRFDLDGVGKGWIADRALRFLAAWPSVVIDADGDLAIRCAAGRTWEVAVDDPRAPDTSLAVLRLTATHGVPGRWGVATSGISIHRWTVDGQARHHLIDPRSGLPAVTDVIQATVVASSALRAETLAKAAVIAGSWAGLALLERARVQGAVILTDRGDVLAPPQTLALLGN
jgi:thiamine biosynthesis lipoprotein